MGQKTVRFSDLSGQLIMDDDALARIVIRDHPDLGQSPAEIEVLVDEAKAIELAALRVAVVDLYFPGEEDPRRVVMETEDFAKLATDKPMSELLRTARPARRNPRPRNSSPRASASPAATDLSAEAHLESESEALLESEAIREEAPA
jgi:hypothetical protein